MLNVTSEVRGLGGGALLRALEPLEGIDLMQRSRTATRLIDWARGPGQLTEAMRIDLRQDGLDLCAAGPLWLAATAQNGGAIGKSVRIGLTCNVNRRWRFYERGNPYVSGPKSASKWELIRGSDSPLRPPSRRARIDLDGQVLVSRWLNADTAH